MPRARGHGRTTHSMLFAALPQHRRPRAAQRAQRSATALAPVSPQKTQSQGPSHQHLSEHTLPTCLITAHAPIHTA